MSRRPLVVLALALASAIIAACNSSSVSAPRRDDTVDDSIANCRSGVWTGTGRCG